ncbi:hypothetical protein FP744_10003441 [Trichoderma asperellum]
MKPSPIHAPPEDRSKLPLLPSSSKTLTLCLPILRVSIDISIDGTISYTRLTQTFHNPSELDIPEARHTFPLYYDAVITSFECKIGDTRRLQGVVKPKAQAKREFEESKAKKREVAALLEELTPEVFETSLGNIPANTTVEISLTYVHELKVVTSKEEKSEGLAITVPTSVAPRYVTSANPATLPKVSSDMLEITIRVLDDGTIDPACCHVESSHSYTIYQGLQPSNNVHVPIVNISELQSLNSAATSTLKLQHVWKYSSKLQPALKSDFVFVIQMLEKSRLQSRAVITPANNLGHAALMVSLRPNDLFGSAVRPDLFKGEILFVLDRSESMGWTQSGTDRRKIETMRNAMSLALSGLPSSCRFNIISFGSEVRGMWIRSKRADELESLSDGREYIASVKADMGGTQVLLALQGAVTNREPTCPSTQIILITDGEISNAQHSSILKYVWETSQKYGKKIRFFTLGIGDSVSHSVMESIAELGGGYCDVVDVVKNARWEGRLNRMLRSAMEPDAWTCDIDLGSRYKRQSLVASKFGADGGDETDVIFYAQGPYPIPSLHPFRYKSFFFLLDLKNTHLPTTVTIRTTSDAAEKKVYTMKVKPTQLRESTIHPLAVKTILSSLENEVKRAGTSEEQARLNAECLGTRYAISSNWTSFVAVADESMEQTRQIDTYKSLFKDADIHELLVPETEEVSEVFWPSSYRNTRNFMDSPANMESVQHLQNLLCSRSITENFSPNPSPNTFKIGIARGTQSGPSVEYTDTVQVQSHLSAIEADKKAPDELIINHNSNGAQPISMDNNVRNYTLQTRKSQSYSATVRDDNDVAYYDVAYNYPTRQDHPLLALGETVHSTTSSINVGTAPNHEDVFFYEPSGEGPITWQDAAGCENRGIFILPSRLKERLIHHFCSKTVERLYETLRNSSRMAHVSEEEVAALVDTLMMIQYFRTHQSDKEDYWSLLMDKAERTLLLALEYDKDQKDALEPLYTMLLSSILHVHFPQSLKHASVHQEETRKIPDPSVLQTCLVCNTDIETDYEGHIVSNIAYACLADECYDINTQSREIYPSWSTFWEHQVESGHILCPEINKWNEEVDVITEAHN